MTMRLIKIMGTLRKSIELTKRLIAENKRQIERNEMGNNK